MIIDWFPFFNELDLLEVRLHELSEIVDVFVLSEATLTFTGKPKRLYFNENKSRFKDFPIEHVIIDSYPKPFSHSLQMDRYQKQCGINAMTEKFKPGTGDIVILSDCDEIPKAKTVKEAIKHVWEVATLKMPLYYYWMNSQCVKEKRSSRWRTKLWRRARMARPDGLLNQKRVRYGKSDVSFPDGGWHFSFLEDIKLKMNSWGHEELNIPPYNTEENIDAKKNVSHAFSNGIYLKDVFDRNLRYNILDDLSYLPQHVLNNMDRFSKYIYEKS